MKRNKQNRKSYKKLWEKIEDLCYYFQTMFQVKSHFFVQQKTILYFSFIKIKLKLDRNCKTKIMEAFFFFIFSPFPIVTIAPLIGWYVAFNPPTVASLYFTLLYQYCHEFKKKSLWFFFHMNIFYKSCLLFQLTSKKATSALLKHSNLKFYLGICPFWNKDLSRNKKKDLCN